MPDPSESDDPLPLSALQHFLFCPRQCALIHVERLWAENVLTAEGRVLHRKTEETAGERRRGVRTVTGLPLRSHALGIAGVADAVEMTWRADGRWHAFPVEYKRGRPKAHRADEVQLCAQALCLEEMLGTPVPEGALFYGATRRRVAVVFDGALRDLTARVAAETRNLVAGGRTPAPVYEAKRCDACSLIELCRPKRLGRAGRGSVARWLANRIAEDGAGERVEE